MGQYRLDSIAQLARQMRFTPIPRRLEQLDSAEDLLLKLSPERAYSLGEVTCALTGYEPKQIDGSLLTGLALQHDLGLFLEEVSESLQIHVNASAEPILTIEEVAQRLSVTTKTVQRWRRRGLPARRYTFADGKRRIGFRFGSVRRFIGSPAGSQEVARPTEMGRDLGWLLNCAADLAGRGFWLSLIAQRLAGQSGLTPLALEQVLRDQASELSLPPAPSASTIAQVLSLRESRLGLLLIARRLSLPRFGVYRILLEQKLTRAARKPIRFHDDPLYHQPQALTEIDGIIAQEPITPSSDVQRIPAGLPPYLCDLYRIPALSKSRERGLFLKYHYLRFLASQEQRKVDPQLSHYRDLRRLDVLRKNARLLRSQLVETNLRLVVSVAKKHLRPGISLMELVSEGNMTLIRAVDGFDIHRGHQFSTYAVYALMRAFARFVPATLAGQRRLVAPESLGEIRDPRAATAHQHAVMRDEVSQLLSNLDSRERQVLAGRYGLLGRKSPLTCRQLGQELRLSSQRIVQIEQTAITKLRSQIATMS